MIVRRSVVKAPAHLTARIIQKIRVLEVDRKAAAFVGGRETVEVDARLWHSLVQLVGA